MPSGAQRSLDLRPHGISRRSFLALAASSAGISLVAACRNTPAEAGPTSPPLAIRTLAPLTEPKITPVPAAQTVAPAAARPEPKGKFSYAWHGSISPAWLDPQENPPQVTPYNFSYTLHDALVKPMPGENFAPSLAESFEISPDNKSATFKLRRNIKFHDGSPVTPEDVKFTFEQYRGASAAVLKAKTNRVELPDERTIRFVFNEPFLDFLVLYGTPASGAGWIVPKAYYEKVGADRFKNAPIGAGPYRFVKQTAGSEIEFEAFPEYWRKTPSVRTIVARGISEPATRLALLKTGEIDVMYQVPGDLLSAVKQDSNLRMTAPLGGACWLEPMALDRPDHPLKDIRVRQAVSLAIDRQAINDAEVGGLSPIEGNWISEEWPGAVKRPVPPTDVARAKELMAEAGVGDGFDVSAITPLPPNTSWAERVASQLRAIKIRTQVNIMERGAFYTRLSPGTDRLKGLIIQFSGAPGDAAARVRENAVCQGAFSGLCVSDIDDRMKAYDASTDRTVRKRLLDDLQAALLDQYYMIPLVRNVFIFAAGTRLANARLEDVIGAIPQYNWIGPWEDLEVKA
jgi:peptide/nickel transport system substrate-binding protein